MSHLPVDQRQIEIFVKVWQKLDPDATYFIPTQKLDELLIELGKDDSFSEIYIRGEKD